jgi:uncharacterized RDD family membrane protein YckC
MSTIRIATNFNIDLEFPAAPFHRRFLAWVCDVVVIVFYEIILVQVAKGFFPSFDDTELSQFIFGLLFFVPLFCYHLFCEILMKGQSIGKKITGVRVVNENGGTPNISQYLIRWMIRTSDIMVVVIIGSSAEQAARGNTQYFVFIAAAFCLLVADVILVNSSKKRQRLGDIVAHTIMIRTKQEADIEQTIFQEIGADYKPSFPQVMQLSDRDINALKSILETAKKRGDYNMAEMASEKIKAHLHIQTSLSPFDFLEVLLKDYNYLSAN